MVLKYTKLATLASKALEIKLIALATVVYRTLWSMMVARHTLVTTLSEFNGLHTLLPPQETKTSHALMHNFGLQIHRDSYTPQPSPKWKLLMRLQIQYGWLAPLTAIFSWTTHASFNKYSALSYIPLIRTKCVCKYINKKTSCMVHLENRDDCMHIGCDAEKNFGFIAEWMKIFNSNYSLDSQLQIYPEFFMKVK